ncbi:GNAT family N-acetyltransferase [Micromonospora terminaliae]|uniref:GNAT family N-acetyltransferase n=1 Tax=Micromonospora terminaliae TaxID=1914461 RepID=A0AAJ2ZKN1_9ACTN|nr:GNAT family N-acetyltransferase [Micromonospora terminaliae]NES31541.1 GNAT family N-acetyltransferase [Micromonospora terminaliae]QGL49651.1 GNAT family N-acetyltransferase [Micromonospora terminaliae]
MNDHVIRPARPEDAPGVVALRTTVHPYLVRGVESTRHMIAQPPPEEDWAAWVAEADGQVVGWVSAYRYSHTSAANVGEVSTLHVHPAHRLRGAGTALLDAALAHLRRIGVKRLLTLSQPESLPFARRHGFTPSRELRYSALDLRPAPPMPEPPPGVRLLTATEVDPRRIHRVDAEASVDEPGDVPTDALGYDIWHHEVWENVGLDREASTVVEVDGALVAVSLVKRDGDRMWSDFTGTVPAHRGRGLAGLAKRAALHRAAAGGVRTAYASNDEANAPMLAVNARLGYRPVASQWSCLRDLT